MHALQTHLPENHAGLMRIADAWSAGPKRQAELQNVYPQLKKVSVDYGIMEPVAKDPHGSITICTVPMGLNWMDVGSWPSYGDTLDPDAQGNRTNARTLHVNSQDILAVSDDPNHTITSIDCKDLIIVHTKDATLVCPQGSAEKIKDLAGKVPESLR
jgi:mannose-1-phosphate guanylyltransferase